MDEHTLREWLAARMKVPEIPSVVWAYLKEGGYVGDALDDGYSSGRDDLLRHARKVHSLSKVWGGEKPRTTRVVQPDVPVPVLGDYERERSSAYWEYLALHASRTPRVRRFRTRFLDGRPLSADQAFRLLTSPAAALLTIEAFEKREIPIVDHRSVVVERDEQQSPDGSLTTAITLRFNWKEGTHEETYRWRRGSVRRPPREVLTFLDNQRRRHETPIRTHSVLDKLRELSGWLARHYGWEQDAAVWFVLTDEAMPRLPLRTGIDAHLRMSHTDCEVTLSVEPWVPADSVMRAYRDLQRQLLGRENRPLSQRNLALFRFMIEQERERERRPHGKRERLTWARLLDRWNQAHPESAYGEERLFVRDISRAQRGVLFPRYYFTATDGQEDG